MKVALLTSAALGLLLVTGCGAAHDAAGKFPVVVAHPQVETGGPNVNLPRLPADSVQLLAPSRVVFNTTGTDACVWWPTRITVTDRSSITIDMRVNGVVTRCSTGAVSFPIAVKLNPRVVDFHRPLTVRLEYKVRIPGAGTNAWEKTGVAAALGGS